MAAILHEIIYSICLVYYSKHTMLGSESESERTLLSIAEQWEFVFDVAHNKTQVKKIRKRHKKT